MATTDLIGAQTRTDRRATAPLPPAAREALSRLELALSGRSTADTLAHEAGSYVRVTPEVQRAVVRFGICLETFARLTMLDARRMTAAEFDLLAETQTEMTGLHEQLEQAGQLHLVTA